MGFLGKYLLLQKERSKRFIKRWAVIATVEVAGMGVFWWLTDYPDNFKHNVAQAATVLTVIIFTVSASWGELTGRGDL